MENSENQVSGAGEGTAPPQGASRHNADCGCEKKGKEHSPAQTSGSGMPLALFAVFGLAILFGGYMLFGIMQGAGTGGCSSENTGACPLDSSIISGGSQEGANGQGSGGSQGDANPQANSNAQDIYIRALSSGTYDKSQIQVQKGVPVRLHFSADPNTGCGRQLVIYGLNVRALSRNGEENVVSFTPNAAGTFEYNCGMRMFRGGKLVVA